MKKNLGISIIIPCYNVQDYIEICLDSLNPQLKKIDYEIILIDDKSTDATVEVIEKYIKNSNLKIELIKNEKNMGAGASRNKAIKKAKYNYISFIDSDDYLDDNYYGEMLGVINEKQNVDVVICDIRCIYEDGTPSVIAGGCEGRFSRLNVINTGFAASPCNKIIKKEWLEKYPFAEGIMNEDVASIIAIIANSHNLEYTDKTKYNYIQRSSSVQNSSLSLTRFDIFKSIEILEERIKDNKDYNKIMKAISFQQLFLFFIFIIPREKNLFKRTKYLRIFRKKSKKYELMDNSYCKENLERRGRKAVFYYGLIFKLNNVGLSFITSFVMMLFQMYHNLKYSKLIGKKISVIKTSITMDDIIKSAKKQSDLSEGPIKISVVIPNYNYEKFLLQRVYSVLYQNYKISELIILDDCSKDGSRDLIDEIEENINNYINIKKIYNKKNSGTAFKQWEKGFVNASGEYVWIAEADDYCEKNMLSLLVDKIKSSSDVMLAYVDTAFIDVSGIKQLKTIKPEIDILNTGHWDKDFINDGVDEIKNYSYLNCTIANVSSCLIKNDDYRNIFEEAGKFKQAGDWYFYISIMEKGKVAFVNKALNYYRAHGNNVTSTTKKEMHLSEIKKIHSINTKKFNLTKKHQEEMKKRIRFLEKVWDLER